MAEGSHVDPDGNLIRFGSPMPRQPAERLRSRLEARYGIEVAMMTAASMSARGTSGGRRRVSGPGRSQRGPGPEAS
jgi:hypothetical protein